MCLDRLLVKKTVSGRNTIHTWGYVEVIDSSRLSAVAYRSVDCKKFENSNSRHLQLNL